MGCGLEECWGFFPAQRLRVFRMMPVATGSIEALRLLPPSGVQYDEDGLQVRYTGPENSQCRSFGHKARSFP